MVRKNEALILEKCGWSIPDEPQTFKNRLFKMHKACFSRIPVVLEVA